MCGKMYKEIREIDISDVPFIQLRFDDKKRLSNHWKEYIINRLRHDMNKGFWINQIPFFYISSSHHIRIFDTTMINNKGERIDK